MFHFDTASFDPPYHMSEEISPERADSFFRLYFPQLFKISADDFWFAPGEKRLYTYSIKEVSA
jgi:hypothetical protein